MCWSNGHDAKVGGDVIDDGIEDDGDIGVADGDDRHLDDDRGTLCGWSGVHSKAQNVDCLPHLASRQGLIQL